MSCGQGCEASEIPPETIGRWTTVLVDVDLPGVACRADDVDVCEGDRCLVETADGHFVGTIASFAPPVTRQPRSRTGTVLRRATDAEVERQNELVEVEREIGCFVRDRARNLGVELYPLKVRLPLQGRKAFVYFTAEQRVDFRSVVRDASRRFRMRVEMRSLGVRDAARLVGGLGPCGRCLCCATFMERFHSVTVRMAKRQQLSLNPTKISGMCGRLMCCLAHEVDQYPPLRGRNR